MSNGTTPALSLKNRYLPELDGIRALSIILVVINHVRPSKHGVAIGYLGVTMFFVLSGYLITSISLAEEAEKGVHSLRGFYIRRSFRIFPAYYFVLGAYCFLILGLNLFPDKRAPLEGALLYYLTYLQEIPFYRAAHGPAVPFYQSWSLGYEEKFYLAWPLICFVILRYRTTWRIPAAALLALACSFNWYTRPYSSILLGCLLALVVQTEFINKVADRTPIGIWAAAFLLLALPFLPGQFWRWELALTLYALLFAFFLGFLVARDNYFKRALRTPLLAFIGKMSYGIYLVHLLCLALLRKKLPVQSTALMALASCCCRLLWRLFFTISWSNHSFNSGGVYLNEPRDLSQPR